MKKMTSALFDPSYYDGAQSDVYPLFPGDVFVCWMDDLNIVLGVYDVGESTPDGLALCHDQTWVMTDPTTFASVSLVSRSTDDAEKIA